MKLTKIRLLDHYSSSYDELEDKNFYLTTVGWDIGTKGKYTRLCMILGNEGEPSPPYMSIITTDIVSKEVLYERPHKRRIASSNEVDSSKVSRGEKTTGNNSK